MRDNPNSDKEFLYKKVFHPVALVSDPGKQPVDRACDIVTVAFERSGGMAQGNATSVLQILLRWFISVRRLSVPAWM
jgi:hypothetical protein